MGKSEGVVRDEVDRVEVDHTTQKAEHEKVDHAELQDGSEEGETCVANIAHRRMDREKDCYQSEGEEDLGFGEITHGKGEPVRGPKVIR